MSSIDCYNDPYQERASSRVKRAEFEKLKKSSTFIAWRTRQVKIQRNQCAYCRINLGKGNVVTHIDHVTPLRFEGKNEYDNFVLSCKKCNLKKWISNVYVYPQWIKDNDNKMRERQRLVSFRKRQQAQAEEINDSIVLDSLGWI